MPLINCDFHLILTWFANCVIIYINVANQNPTFVITEKKPLLQQLKSGFKTAINCNKYLSKPELLAQNPNLNHLVEPIFQGVNRLFVLAFADDAQRTNRKGYYLPNVEMKDYNFMIDGKSFFDQPVKNNKVTYENIIKIATDKGDDYTTGFLLDYTYFKNYYKMIAIDLSKQQSLDANPRAIQQINFNADLNRARNTRIFFILEEAKETILVVS